MIGDRRVLAVIPARGGSKGIPRKNIAPLCDRPLIAWTIDAAAGSRYVDRAVVSSEEPEIIAVSRARGGDVPFVRPAGLARDDTPGMAPLLHAADQLPGYDLLVCLQPTSPCRTSADIDACIERAVEAGAPCVTVCESPKSPWWMFTLGDGGRLSPLMAGPAPLRRQESPPTYVLNGAVYVAELELLRARGSYLVEETTAVVMPHDRSVDIDTPLDLAIAEWWLCARTNGEER
jgi:N-acylneuraminate cytidylyltransferase